MKITIHQSASVSSAVIDAENVMEAHRIIRTPSSIALFDYLAKYEDGTTVNINEDVTHLSRASYFRAKKHLTNLGYIFKDYGGRLNFATTPDFKEKLIIHDWE